MTMDEKALEFELNDDERRELEYVMRQPGYRTMLRVMSSYAKSLQDGAIAISMSDPLNEAYKVQNAWAYAKMGRHLCAAFEGGLKFELEVLRQHDERPSPDKLAKMRREQFTLEAIPQR